MSEMELRDSTRIASRDCRAVIGRSDRALVGGTGRSPKVRLRALLLAALSGTSVLVGPGAVASGAPTSNTASLAGYSVGIERCTFVDTSRSTPNFDTRPPSVLSKTRTLVTEIRYPTHLGAAGVAQTPGAVPVARSGGFPMIVFAHGYDVTPDTYAPLLDAWVKAGFVVAAPFFPDEDRSGVAAQHSVNTEDDLWNEPADLTFVTRQILDDSSAASAGCPIVHGLIRSSELALAGHSDGATVVAMLSYAHGKDPYRRTYQQLRAGLDFRATIVLSGQVDGVDPYGPLSPDPSLLLVQSVADQCNLFHNGVQLYRAIHQNNKWFLELRTAHHLPPFDGADVAAFDVVTHASIRFLQIALEGARPQSGLVDYGDVNPPVALMFHAGSGPAIVAPTESDSCGPD